MPHQPSDDEIDRIAGRFGLSRSGLVLLGGGYDWSDGTVWLDRSGGRILKVKQLPVGDAVGAAVTRDRLRLVGALVIGGAPLIRPLPAADGDLVVEVDTGESRFVAYTYRFVPGRHMRLDDACVRSGGYYRAVGHELGRMHAASETSGWRRRADGTSSASEVLGGWREEWSYFRGLCGDDVVAAWERLGDALGGLAISSRTYGFTQNDAHSENFVFVPDSQVALSGGEPGLTLIDVDVSNFHWYASDVATALYSFECTQLGRPEAPGRALPDGFQDFVDEALRDGYRRHRDISADWLDLVQLFVQYRRCLLFMALQSVVASDPEWHDQWLNRIQACDRQLFG